MLNPKQTKKLIEEIIKLFPDSKPSLNFTNNFELLISVMLSAQTTDNAVNKITPELFRVYPTPEAMAKAELEDIQDKIKSIGLYKNKSKYAKQISQKLVDEFDSQVPSTRRELISLRGVGRKTANVVLSLGFSEPAFAVDTHVTRVCKHHKIVPESFGPDEIEKRVCACLPAEMWTQAHLSMIRFGREICHPKNPECENYPQLYDL